MPSDKISKKGKKVVSTCGDRNCPIHGSLKIRGRMITGTVVRDKMSKTVAVQWERRRFIPKFERHQKKWSKVKAHNPPCLNVKIGDIVNIAECRPISKDVKFTVIERVGDEDVKEVERLPTHISKKKIKEEVTGKKDESDKSESK